MTPYISKKFFSRNRQLLRARLDGPYPILVVGNGLLQRAADTTYPFHQDSNFWYLTGLDTPDLTLYIDKRGTSYLLVPALSDMKAVFDGAHDEAMFTAQSGITHIIPESEGLKRIISDISKTKHLYTPAEFPAYDVSSGTYANPAAARFLRRLRRAVSRLELEDIQPNIAELRVRKQPEEIAALEAAIAVTTEAFATHRTATALRALGSEYALEAAFTRDFREKAKAGHAYGPIIAGGSHATTLHYIANSGALHSNELIVVDVGAEVEHYAADITRTLSMAKPSARQQAVLNEVVGLQSQALELLQPGIQLRDYERAVVQYMGKALVRLQLISDANDISQIRQYYPHATSHFLGLDVHDVGDYDAPLEAGMVLTCEPGIYIPEEGIGVRIEDDVLLTADGNRNLSGHCSYDAYVLH